jgi:hypothetical protein
MKLLALLLCSGLAAFAQVADGITTVVSRTVNIVPDEADFVVAVSTALDTTQDQVVQAFHDAGVQNLTVTGVAAGPNNATYPPSGISLLYYQITFTTAPAALTSYAKKMDAMGGKLPGGLSSLQYSAALNASQVAVDAAHQTTLALLLQDARTKAQAIATAAGLKLGGIAGVSESNSAVGYLASPQFVNISATFSSSNIPSNTAATFYATVKFAAQ